MAVLTFSLPRTAVMVNVCLCRSKVVVAPEGGAFICAVTVFKQPHSKPVYNIVGMLSSVVRA